VGYTLKIYLQYRLISDFKIIIIIIINAGTRHRVTIHNKDRITATMYPLGTWFVSGICVWLPCIKETLML